MRNVAVALLALAVLAFVVGTYSAFSGSLVLAKAPVTYWRGAIGFLLFAVTLLLLERPAARS